MSEPIPPPQDIYVVEFERHKGDLGVSLILRASCEVEAKLKASRFWPEYKRLASRTHAFLLEYVEIDWDSGRCLVIKRNKRREVPAAVAEISKSLMKKPPRHKGEGDAE